MFSIREKMMSLSRRAAILTAALLAIACLLPSGVDAAYKVLVVMSYHESMPWEMEIREGIEAELAQHATIRYFYMNTKNDFAGGAAKAKEALDIYREFKPDGIIAADDDAVSLFVVPYIKNKVKTPVMFCGINEKPETYGFPASNVSGILERAHFRESMAFLHQILPSVKKIAFLTNDTPTGRAYVEQIRREEGTYPSTITVIKRVKTLDEALAVTKDLKKRSDALFVIAMEGIPDASGKHFPEKDAFRKLSRKYGKPVIGVNEFNIRSGLLCAVVKSGQEQGTTAAKMLLLALRGNGRIPDTHNQQQTRQTSFECHGHEVPWHSSPPCFSGRYPTGWYGERVSLRLGILKKLLIMHLLVFVVFATIILAVFLSFRDIESFTRKIINTDVNQVVVNAQLGRDLNGVFADTDLLVGTFLNRDEDLRKRNSPDFG